tara:strand:- start:354 stop:581 length:228 start_codon:yes stop_codon:yes gene_type:complete
MRTIILITGEIATGKSIVARKIQNSVEVHDLEEVYKKDFIENIVLTTTLDDIETKNILKKIAKKTGRMFIKMSTE